MKLLLCAILLGGCAAITGSDVPDSVPYTAAEHKLAQYARSLWVQSGQPKPRCDDSDDQIRIAVVGSEWLQRACRVGHAPCEAGGPTPCADSCVVYLGGSVFAPSKMYLLVHEDRDRCFIWHEYLHRLEGCRGNYDYDHSADYWKSVVPILERLCRSDR